MKSERLQQAIEVGMVQVDEVTLHAIILAPPNLNELTDDEWIDVLQAATEVGRELTGLPAFGMDSHGYVQRYFHPVTLECWPADKYPVSYYLRFRIANVLVLVATLSNNDDEAPRAADLIRRGQVIEQRVRDKLVYN